MSNNFLSAFAIVTVIGFSAALLPRLAAPSDSYISESLEPTEEPFYFIDNPDSAVINSGESYLLSALTNQPECVYSWEYKLYDTLNVDWQVPPVGTFLSGCYYRHNYTTSRPYTAIFYRCKASYNGITIYSVPCVVMIYSDSKSFTKILQPEEQALEKNLEFYDSENNSEFEESEKIEVFDENERSVENAE